MTSAVGGRHLLLQWLARPMFLVSRVSSGRRPTLLSPQMSCRPHVYPATCSPRRAGVPNGPVHAQGQIESLYRLDRGRGGLADVVGGRRRRLRWYSGSGNQTFGGAGQPSTSTVRVWVMMLCMKASHGTCSVRPCPPVPTCARRLYSGQANQRPRRLPPIRNHIGKNSRGREGGVPSPPPPPDRTALGGTQYGSTWHRDTHTHTHTQRATVSSCIQIS